MGEVWGASFCSRARPCGPSTRDFERQFNHLQSSIQSSII
jgi:hypothetical protein